ncbi:uncharacterized protein LOC102803439 [Saccoglossus kowalevskii]|uniref:Uncharacterized protein LOC102803439 n=1 Tax=Saccoglossus kowalevskii TaxID=10224 RepID=A0ABM0MZC2_SACKO|nr:PREDICTED: uncharacterized protein LOC102803439 [Saccoglossus kowalevskii]
MMSVGKLPNSIKTDLRLLLECLKCNMNQPQSLKDALVTIAEICSDSDEGKECLLDCGGILFIQSLLTSTKHTDVKEAALYTLSCVVDRNSECQNLARKSNCLHVLLQLFRSTSEHLENRGMFGKIVGDMQQFAIWSSILGALCVLVNNPSNVSIQERFRLLGGLKTVVLTLDKLINGLNEKSSTDRLNELELGIHIASTLNSCVTDNNTSKQCISNYGAVELLLSLLSNDVLSINSKLQLVLTIAHCTDSCVENQLEFVESGGLSLVVKYMTEIQNDEFMKASTYLLQTCVQINDENSIQTPLNIAEKYDDRRAVREMENPLANVDKYVDKLVTILDRLEAKENSLVSSGEQNTDRRNKEIENRKEVKNKNNETTNQSTFDSNVVNVVTSTGNNDMYRKDETSIQNKDVENNNGTLLSESKQETSSIGISQGVHMQTSLRTEDTLTQSDEVATIQNTGSKTSFHRHEYTPIKDDSIVHHRRASTPRTPGKSDIQHHAKKYQNSQPPVEVFRKPTIPLRRNTHIARKLCVDYTTGSVPEGCYGNKGLNCSIQHNHNEKSKICHNQKICTENCMQSHNKTPKKTPDYSRERHRMAASPSIVSVSFQRSTPNRHGTPTMKEKNPYKVHTDGQNTPRIKNRDDNVHSDKRVSKYTPELKKKDPHKLYHDKAATVNTSRIKNKDDYTVHPHVSLGTPKMVDSYHTPTFSTSTLQRHARSSSSNMVNQKRKFPFCVSDDMDTPVRKLRPVNNDRRGCMSVGQKHRKIFVARWQGLHSQVTPVRNGINRSESEDNIGIRYFQTHCPGCSRNVGGMLTSRTYNKWMDRSSGTCDKHQKIRQQEKKLIKEMKNKDFICPAVKRTPSSNSFSRNYSFADIVVTPRRKIRKNFENMSVYDFISDD